MIEPAGRPRLVRAWCTVSLAVVAAAHSRTAPAQTPTVSLGMPAVFGWNGIGDTSGFTAIQALATVDGGLAVSDVHRRQLRRYDESGQLLWSKPVPDRHSYPSLAAGPNATLVLDRSREAALILLDSTGREVRRIPLRDDSGIETRLLGELGQDWLLLAMRRGVLSGGAIDPVAFPLYHVMRVNPASRQVDTIFATMDSTPTARANRWAFVRTPFAATPLFARTANGFAHSTNGGSSLTYYSANGTPKHRADVPVEVRPVTEEPLDAYLARIARDDSASGDGDQRVVALRTLPPAKWQPAFRAAFGAATGELALVRSRVNDADSTRVDLLDVLGKPLGHVLLPPAETLLGFDGRHLYASRPDSARTVITLEGKKRPAIYLVRYPLEKR